MKNHTIEVINAGPMPVIIGAGPACLSALKSKLKPTMKSKNVIPNWANISISSVECKIPKNSGPAIIPVIKYAIIVG